MCDSQDELDCCWQGLGAGGDQRAQQCGWLKDKFGLSWQNVPRLVIEMLRDGDVASSERVFAAMLQMNKLDVAKLQQAYDGE